MKSERWQQIERLCHEALEREKSQRAAFLEDACGGDETLRHEVEDLLAQVARPPTATASGRSPTSRPRARQRASRLHRLPQRKPRSSLASTC